MNEHLQSLTDEEVIELCYEATSPHQTRRFLLPRSYKVVDVTLEDLEEELKRRGLTFKHNSV